MKLSEYITQNLPFFHITHFKNKVSILKNGLSNKTNIQGICVIRSSDIRIIKMIAIGQLKSPMNPSNRFCVFKIIPSKHNILETNVKKDITDEFTNPLHNYIVKSPLILDTNDIFIDDIIINDSAVPDFSALEKELLTDGIITQLEY
jgi:hypothetical protein